MKPIEACDCAQGASNVLNLGGHGECGKGIARPIHGILGSMFKTNGDPNGIVVGTDVLDQAFFDSKFQDENALDRWLLAEGFLTEYDSPIVDPNVEDIPDGRTFILNENTKQVTTSIITDEYATLGAAFKSHTCRNMGWMFVDANKSLLGHLKTETNFTFRKIQPGSFYVDTVEPTTANKGRVQLRWKWDASALDTQVDYFTKSAMGGYDIGADAEALIDVSIVQDTMIATTGALQFDLKTLYGGADVDDRFGAGGLSEVNLEIFNVTDQVLVPVDDITETTTLGTYIATYTGTVDLTDFVEVRGITQLYVQKQYDLKKLIGVTKETE